MYAIAPEEKLRLVYRAFSLAFLYKAGCIFCEEISLFVPCAALTNTGTKHYSIF